MQNTGEEPPPPANNDLVVITNQAETSQDAQVAKIENDLQAERDSRKEERFIWIFSLFIIADLFTFPEYGWKGLSAIIFMEILFLLILAACLGLEHVVRILNTVVYKILESFSSKDRQ